MGEHCPVIRDKWKQAWGISAGFSPPNFRWLKWVADRADSTRSATQMGPTLQAAVLGRAGPGEHFLAVPRQAESPLCPRGVYFIMRRLKRLERTRRREGFDAALPHHFWGEN